MRVLLVANDGLGAGHVTRALAIGRGLQRRANRCNAEIEILLATTSEADPLLSASQVPCVRWPTPLRAREAGWTAASRRDLGTRVLAGAIEGFQPDLLVTDTFPLGPHGELSGLVTQVPHRALVRRSVRPDRASDPVLRFGLADYQMAIVPDDPLEHRPEELPIARVRVPPITLFEADEMHDREAARARLGVPSRATCILVAAGGGGDPETTAISGWICEIIAKLRPATLPVFAEGPLLREQDRVPTSRALTLRECPLQPWLSAFDGAIVSAGYNLAHELAKASVPLALFGMPRAYDDPAARAARFELAGLAKAVHTVDEASIGEALAWMERSRRTTRSREPRPDVVYPAAPVVAPGGADAAADALLRFALGGAP